jgi:competence protein ComEA
LKTAHLIAVTHKFQKRVVGMERKTIYGALYVIVVALAAVGVLLVAARRPAGQAITLAQPPTETPLRVHVTGAVQNNGVYELPRGSVVQDALTAAGGPLANADVSGLNLAEPLIDGRKIAVPEILPTATPVPPTATVGPGTPTLTPPPEPTATQPPSRSSGGVTVSGKVNINTATVAQLDTLPRIGPAIAQRIIDYRTTNGPFQTIEEIQNVRGIGPATFEQLKDLITVTD